MTRGDRLVIIEDICAYDDIGMLPISVEVNKKYSRDGIKAILVKVGK